MSYKKDCYYDWRDLESAGTPDEENLSLPFLAYGLFKPHQLAYSQIKRFVDGKPKKVKINYELKNVNGIPVLENKISNDEVDASIIKFEKDMEEDAYEAIGYTKNMHIYRWEVINVNNQNVNVLMYSDSKDFPGRTDTYNNYDWRNDPVFESTFEYLDWQTTQLKSMPYKYQWDDLRPFIGVQSLYMTLWSSLDRFLTLRYGKSQRKNVKLLSREKSFRKSLKKNHAAMKESFYGGEGTWSDKIFSAEDLESYDLDPKRPACSALYYYTLRNNVVHSSKVNPQEVNTVWNALLGLTEIFRDVFNAVKKE